MNITAGRTASTNYNDDDKCCCCHSFERRQCKKDKDRDEVRFVVSMIPKILFRVSLTLHSLKKRKRRRCCWESSGSRRRRKNVQKARININYLTRDSKEEVLHSFVRWSSLFQTEKTKNALGEVFASLLQSLTAFSH